MSDDKFTTIRVKDDDADFIKNLMHEFSAREHRDYRLDEIISIVLEVYREQRGKAEQAIKVSKK